MEDDGRIVRSDESESDEEITYYKDLTEKLEAEARKSLEEYIDPSVFEQQQLREACTCSKEFPMCQVLQGQDHNWVTHLNGCDYAQRFGGYFEIDFNASKPYLERVGNGIRLNYDLRLRDKEVQQ